MSEKRWQQGDAVTVPGKIVMIDGNYATVSVSSTDFVIVPLSKLVAGSEGAMGEHKLVKPPKVIAVLLTRCGCSREVQWGSYPPPPQIHMVLRGKDGTTYWNSDLGKPQVEERVFQLELLGHQNEKKGELHALYREV